MAAAASLVAWFAYDATFSCTTCIVITDIGVCVCVCAGLFFYMAFCKRELRGFAHDLRFMRGLGYMLGLGFPYYFRLNLF
jgi:hypothetical protein